MHCDGSVEHRLSKALLIYRVQHVVLAEHQHSAASVYVIPGMKDQPEMLHYQLSKHDAHRKHWLKRTLLRDPSRSVVPRRRSTAKVYPTRRFGFEAPMRPQDIPRKSKGASI